MSLADSTHYLFVGDSLTEGVYGASYVERVAGALVPASGEANSVTRDGGVTRDERVTRDGVTRDSGDTNNVRVVNGGRSGETVASLRARLPELLQEYHPHWVVLAVGVNDVWLPWLAQHSLGWRLWLGYRGLSTGMRATVDLDSFAAAYRDLLDQVHAAGAQVVACTVGPVGEELSSALNARVARLNGTIKHVAAERHVPVADVWQATVEVLSAAPRRSGYVPGEWLFVWVDRQRYRPEAVDHLAERRRLHLTFDGLHLNTRGAELWATTVLDALGAAQLAAQGRRPPLADRLNLPSLSLGPLQVSHSPGWQARAQELGHDLAGAYEYLSSLTGARPAVSLAVLSRRHWEQSGCPIAYPAPHGEWKGRAGTLYLPDTYDESFVRDWQVPAAVAAWTAWPPDLSAVEAPARVAALADLLAMEELARLFLYDLQVAPADPELAQLLAAYLAQVVLYSRPVGGARIAGAWNAWGELLARAGADAGQRRVRAHELYKDHGEDLVATFAGHASPLAERVDAFPSR